MDWLHFDDLVDGAVPPGGRGGGGWREEGWLGENHHQGILDTQSSTIVEIRRIKISRKQTFFPSTFQLVTELHIRLVRSIDWLL